MLCIGAKIANANDNKVLTEVQYLKAENHQLKLQLTQCQANLVDNQLKIKSSELSSEQLQLEAEFRKQLNAKDTDTFNWNTLQFDHSK